MAGTSKSLNSTFLALSWRLELFTHIVPVPISIYFSATLVPMNPEQSLTAFVAGTISGGLMVMLGMAWRYARLRIVFRKKEAGNAGLEAFKRQLLTHPLHEAAVIALRWILGVPLAHAMYILYRDELNWSVHSSAPFLLLMITPVSMAAYFYISESVLRRVLSAPDLRALPVPGLFRLGYFSRILFTVVALMMMPLTMQTYLIYQFLYGNLKIANPLLHIAIVVVLFLIPTVIAAFAVARAVRAGLSDTGEVLSQLGEGHFEVTAAARTADEFGEQAIHLNSVVRRLKEMYETIEDMNLNLEKQVEDRTTQLQQSLEEVHALKNQQDGDYYLTSHLLKPLSSQDLESETVRVDQFVKQKKQFTFKDQPGEIGGDLCTAHTMRLRDRSYIVFLNGDAMGKSIQGAGGAIVLGTVFKSIVARTSMVDSQSKKFPEQWLRDAYTELQTVFSSFDGFMQASATIGLIDEVNGFLYYFSADHPPMALYRKGKASFLSEQTTMRLGIEGLGSEFHINTFSLEPGDVLVAGSDGRDDLVLERSAEGVRVFNDDEQAFLKHVQSADGRLDAIAKSLAGVGEITDDLSLMRIAYREGDAKAVEENAGLLKKATEAFGIKDYFNAARLYGEYLDLDPSREDLLFQASYSYKLARRYENACDFGERCRLRNPGNVRNLINLGDIYRLMGNRGRGLSLLEEARRLEPENPSLAKLEAVLNP
ncbi:MAG: SpoIIE family protein phosphatase [Leptospiraceae bacterium]|nr:SpoIIE family protein phosphatase [Leptospiraceae bacterium]